jgi:alpha-amylase
MATKFFSDGLVHAYFNPYETPYDAFMNYMNVLSDFEIRLTRCLPPSDEKYHIKKLDSIIVQKDEIIEKQAAEIAKLTKKVTKTKTKTKSKSKAGTKVKVVAAKSVADKLPTKVAEKKVSKVLSGK